MTGTVNLAYKLQPDVLAYATYSRGYKAGGLNLSNINNNVESCVKREAKLIGPDGSDQIDVCEIFFIATVYCYAFPKTHLGSLFGTLIGQLYVCSRVLTA